jgi:plasmid replication initiation protein
MSNNSKLIVEMAYPLARMLEGFQHLREYRLFLIYLGKINARNQKNSILRLPLSEFATICEIDNPKNPKEFFRISDNLLNKNVKLPVENGGYKNFILFESTEIAPDENGDWYFEIVPTNAGIAFMYDIKQYIRFNLKYAIKLKSIYQLKLYCLLQSYKYDGSYEVDLLELKEILGFKADQYSGYPVFNRDILKPYQQILNSETDIFFSYDTVRKGRGGKVTKIKFTITDNSERQVLTKELVEIEKTLPKKQVLKENVKITFSDGEWYTNGRYSYKSEVNEYYADMCQNIFSETEIESVIDLVRDFTPIYNTYAELEHILANKLSNEFKQFTAQVAKKQNTVEPVKAYYNYFIKILENKAEEYKKECAKRTSEGMREMEQNKNVSESYEDRLLSYANYGNPKD